MPRPPATTKRTSVKRARRQGKRKLSNAQLLKLAQKNRPPVHWFDERIDPTKPPGR